MSIPFDPPRPRPSGGGGGGGAAGFTPVLFTAQWNADRVQNGARAIEPDTIISEEGITSGSGTESTPYGWSYSTTPSSAGSETYWKVSEEMAGVYTLTITWTAQRRDPNPTSAMVGPVIELRRDGADTDILFFQYDEAFNTTADKKMVFSSTVTLRMNAEDRLNLQWGGYQFFLEGNSTNSPGGWISMVKVSN